MQNNDNNNSKNEYCISYLVKQLKRKDHEVEELQKQLIASQQLQSNCVEKVITIDKIVEPDDYGSLKQENMLLKEKLESCMTIIQCASLSTGESIVKRIFGYLQPEILELMNVLVPLAGTRDGQKILKDIRDYFRNLDQSFSRLISDSPDSDADD